jgi:hypothetical protein
VNSIRDEFDRQLQIAQQQVIRNAYNPPTLEGRPMAAPETIKNFAGTLRDHLKRATDRAMKQADKVKGSVDNFHARMDDVDKMTSDIDSASAEIHQIVGMDNGGPA